MKSIFCLVAILFSITQINAQVTLNSDGAGGMQTYDLINSVLAPGYDAVEEPDCSHTPIFQHIDEPFDTTLGINVFRFYIHVATDTDRCNGSTDRQRNEIKTYDKSPDNLKGIEGESVIYKWKFKLDVGFQVSSNFTHLHQLKSVGGLYESMPMYTLTARKSSPDRLELRYAETNSQTTLIQVPLSDFKGEWVEATESIKFGTNASPDSGTYAIEIKRVSDQTILLSYSDNTVKNWQTDAEFVRPKWGIYRSLNSPSDLRDEEVLFADFSIEEVGTLSTNISNIETNAIKMVPNPSKEEVTFISKKSNAYDYYIIYNNLGQQLTSKNTQKTFNTSKLKTGTYHVVFYKNNLKTQTEKLVIK
ncbi:T9SS type A sorting domain-containing protein [Algibacter sp.]|uniref:T9SS type A sorting domain-containing protein n=1 Tax=Algibacter sp. TaxID=1872428 RepID=UPI003C791DD5